ncbi:Fic family protein [Bergeyella zoohelcum]|uniref:Cell filamentation protein Fic n=1 Tax=Bergeyella zoohelcum TaxID=1015 RepID=A0A7Z8YNR3_9FLAO|nr:Fic family protein [Bergeyella zoohelcum]VDH04095.1 cell filamentation protein Fic [Bergeyella zoohelcum]
MNYQELDILNEKLNGYRANFSQKIAQALDIEYTHESNKIEGNTLTLRETAIVIEKGLTIGGKPLNDHLEAINHAQAIDYIKDLVKATNTITDRDILQIHALILQGIDRENAGRYRSVPVMISGSKHTPPPPYVVPEKMQEMMDFYNENMETMHPVELASEMHERLVYIHPFADGNGRTARLLMNLILLQNGYPIAILKGDTENRLKYYEALETASITGDKTPFKNFIKEVLTQTINRILEVVE